MTAVAVRWLQLELARRWRALLGLALLVALSGAVVVTSLAGAHRGATAVDRLLSVTLPSTAVVTPNQPGFDWNRVAELPEVEALTTFPAYMSLAIVEARNDDLSSLVPADAAAMRSIERPVILRGRLADPGRADEVVVTPAFVARVGRGVGDGLTLHLPTLEQATANLNAQATDEAAGPLVRLRIVGVVRSLWWGDDVGGAGNVIPSPMLLSQYRANLLGTKDEAAFSGLVRLTRGDADLPRFRADLARVTGRPDIDVVSRAESVRHARDVTRFESVCLLAFGLVALLAAAVMIAQAIGRYTRGNAPPFGVLTTLGMTRRQAVALGTVAPTLAATAGALLGLGLAVLCSQWLPFGAAAQREPTPGVDVDWAVLTLGGFAITIFVGLGASVSTFLSLPNSRRTAPARASMVAIAAARAGLPLPAVLGARLAFESGAGSRAMPVRPALLGSVVGVTGVVAALVFSAGVADAASHPQRFGQTYELEAALGVGGQDFVPVGPVLAALARDPDVAAVTNLRVAAATSGPTSILTNSYGPVGAAVALVLTTGRVPGGDDEIVLAPSTAHSLRAAVGTELPLTGDRETRVMRVVGIGYGVQSSTATYDSGSWVTPTAFDRLFTGFKEHAGLLELRPGADPTAVIPQLQRSAATVAGGESLLIFPPFTPLQVHEINDVRTLPLLLGAFLFLLALLAVGHGLIIAVRRRELDLAILRALGLTPTQSRGIVVAHAFALAGTGVVVGVPTGLALGRTLWRAAANIMPLQYEAPLPVVVLVFALPAALVAAAALAVYPARRVARLRVGHALRTQ